MDPTLLVDRRIGNLIKRKILRSVRLRLFDSTVVLKITFEVKKNASNRASCKIKSAPNTMKQRRSTERLGILFRALVKERSLISRPGAASDIFGERQINPIFDVSGPHSVRGV